MAKKMAQAKAAEEAPLQTKAMRDLKKLQDTKVDPMHGRRRAITMKNQVYKQTAIRVQFAADRLVCAANFHPLETIDTVAEVVASLLKSQEELLTVLQP
jgi:hypothetical protein